MCVRVCLCACLCVSVIVRTFFLALSFFCPLDSSMTFYFSVAFEESMYSGTFFTMHSINLLSKFPRLTCVQGLLIHSLPQLRLKGALLHATIAVHDGGKP